MSALSRRGEKDLSQVHKLLSSWTVLGAVLRLPGAASVRTADSYLEIDTARSAQQGTHTALAFTEASGEQESLDAAYLRRAGAWQTGRLDAISPLMRHSTGEYCAMQKLPLCCLDSVSP